MTWDEWLEVLCDVKANWPLAAQGEGYLTMDFGGEYAKMDTLRAWHHLLSGFTQAQVFSAVFRYAETDEDSQWPPQGPTLARYAREVAAEDQARAARERAALPAPEPNVTTLRDMLARLGFDSWREWAKSRCQERNHHLDWVTDETCNLCNDRPPRFEALSEALS